MKKSIVPFRFSTAWPMWINSVAPSPTMWHPSNLRVFSEKIIFIMPVSRPMMWPREVSRKRAMPHS